MIKTTEKKRIERLIVRFLKDHNLTQYRHNGVIYIDDISPNCGTIKIYDQEKLFEIRVYLEMCGEYRSVCQVVMHELTHLYLHEITSLYEFMERNEAPAYMLKELVEVGEKITHKLSELFSSIYLDGI